MSTEQLTLDALLADGIQPASIVPRSKRLTEALAAVARLSVVELTYVGGRIAADLETYRAQLVDATLNTRNRE